MCSSILQPYSRSLNMYAFALVVSYSNSSATRQKPVKHSNTSARPPASYSCRRLALALSPLSLPSAVTTPLLRETRDGYELHTPVARRESLSISFQKCRRVPNIDSDVTRYEETLTNLSPHFGCNSIRANGYPQNGRDLNGLLFGPDY